MSRRGGVDFEHINDLKYELRVLHTIFDWLRAGRLSEVQQFLEQTDNSQQYLWLIGNIPFFDNFKYA